MSGVRISWLMLARNSLFARDRRSASARATCRSAVRAANNLLQTVPIAGELPVLLHPLGDVLKDRDATDDFAGRIAQSAQFTATFRSRAGVGCAIKALRIRPGRRSAPFHGRHHGLILQRSAVEGSACSGGALP